MNNSKPDFYLASGDVNKDDDLAQPRKCWRIKRLLGDTRDDYLLIQIDPPIIGQAFGLGGKDIDKVIVVPKSGLVALQDIRDWPVLVYLIRSLVEHPETRDVIHDAELALLGWAELYETREDALRISEG